MRNMFKIHFEQIERVLKNIQGFERGCLLSYTAKSISENNIKLLFQSLK